jgi:Protein of unknown function (DUF3102)
MKTTDIKQVAQEAQASDLRVSMSDGDASSADEINSRHRKIVAAGETVLEEAIKIGELLTANKAAVKHGAWLKWIDKNLEFGSVMAQRYMRIFDNKDELQKRLQKTHLVTITDAYLLLAKKTDRKVARANGKPIDDFGGETTPAAAAVIDEAGGIISESAAKATGRYNGNGDQWDDKPALAHPTHNKIYNPNGGQMPDQAANVLHDLGVICEPFAQDMYAAIERESRSARTIAKEERAQAKLAAEAEAATHWWAKLKHAIREQKPALLLPLGAKFVTAESQALDGKIVFFADDDETKQVLVICGAEPGSCYTREELAELAQRNVTSDELVRVHAAKQQFNGTVAP